jgi:hypothetical protein
LLVGDFQALLLDRSKLLLYRLVDWVILVTSDPVDPTLPKLYPANIVMLVFVGKIFIIRVFKEVQPNRTLIYSSMYLFGLT